MDLMDIIDEKSHRSLQLFCDRIRTYVDDVEIPEDDEYIHDNLKELVIH